MVETSELHRPKGNMVDSAQSHPVLVPPVPDVEPTQSASNEFSPPTQCQQRGGSLIKNSAFLAFLIATCGVEPFALGEDTPAAPDPVAVELFARGRELVSRGEWEQGCQYMSQSMTRYPAASTLMNLARCREHEGKLASAWAAYRRALQLNRETPGLQRRQELEDLANRELSALEPRLPRLQAEMTKAPQGLTVQEAGRDLPLHVPVPLDPGEYELVATAPGFQRLTRRVSLVEGRTTIVDLLLTPESPPPPSPVAAPPSTPAQPTSRPLSVHSGDQATLPTWVWISGVAGLVSVGAATTFAVDAKTTYNKLADICGGDLVCDEAPEYDPSPANARKRRDIGLAIGLGAAGLVSLTASVIGIVVTRSGQGRGPALSTSLYFPAPATAGALVQGVF